MRSPPPDIFIENASRRRGIALILVLLVMAVASILAFAMLSAGALQAAAGSNSITAAAAQAQAESGIHLAAYYLTHPDTAPVSAGGWGPTTVTFTSTQPPTALPGSVSVTVAPVLGSTNYFTVSSVGSVPTSTDGQQITRTITAELEVIPSYQISGAGAFNTASLAVKSGVTINGAVSTTGTVNIQGSGAINGDVSASGFLGGAPNGQELPAPASSPAPTGALTDYTQQYYYQGTLYSPGPISATGGTYGPTATNPLGIYYNSGTLTVTGPLSITGTLYIKGGTLVDGNTIVINPVTLPQMTYSMPALVVDQAIEMKANATLTVNGVVCSTQGITNLAANASTLVNITGALLITNNGGGITNGSAHVNITYNSAYTNVLNLVANDPPAIKVISWSE
jgi:Tfp pilus assembly protein PilX